MAAGSLVVVSLLVMAVVGAEAQDATPGLRGLPRVAVEIALGPDLAGLEDDLEQRVTRALRDQPPAPGLDGAGAPKLRLVVTVQALGATELRGFWLPFSGTYAVGTVRLELERAVTLPGPTPAGSGIAPAIVWHAERLIARPWRQVAAEVTGAVDELVQAFLEDYRRARAR